MGWARCLRPAWFQRIPGARCSRCAGGADAACCGVQAPPPRRPAEPSPRWFRSRPKARCSFALPHIYGADAARCGSVPHLGSDRRCRTRQPCAEPVPQVPEQAAKPALAGPPALRAARQRALRVAERLAASIPLAPEQHPRFSPARLLAAQAIPCGWIARPGQQMQAALRRRAGAKAFHARLPRCSVPAPTLQSGRPS